MHYIIIFIIALLVIIFLGEQILFNPKVNAVISIIITGISIGFLIMYFKENATDKTVDIISMGILLVPMIIILIDCLRDIILAEKCYKDINVGIDKLFMVKSLLSLFTFGFARIVFLFIIGPIISCMVSWEIKMRIKKEEPLPCSTHFSKLEMKNYYYKKRVEKLENKGILVSNIKTVESEAIVRRKKLEKLYPEKLVAKIVDMVAGDVELKNKRKNAEAKLSSWSLEKNYAYLKKEVFSQFPQLIIEAMEERGYCSVSDIKNFEELRSLKLEDPIFLAAYNNKSTEWGEYFIIQALQPLVVDGTFEDNDFNDSDVFDNHAYHYTKSLKSMPSIDGDSDPRFALDDD